MKEVFLIISSFLQIVINNNCKWIGVYIVVIMIIDGYWNLGDLRVNVNVFKKMYNVDLFMVGVDGYGKWQLDVFVSSNDYVLEFLMFIKFYEFVLFIRGGEYKFDFKLL